MILRAGAISLLLWQRRKLGINLFKEIQLSNAEDLFLSRYITLLLTTDTIMDYLLLFFSGQFSILVPPCFSTLDSCCFPHRSNTASKYFFHLWNLSLSPSSPYLTNAMFCCFYSWIVLESTPFSTTVVPPTSPGLLPQEPPLPGRGPSAHSSCKTLVRYRNLTTTHLLKPWFDPGQVSHLVRALSRYTWVAGSITQGTFKD